MTTRRWVPGPRSWTLVVAVMLMLSGPACVGGGAERSDSAAARGSLRELADEVFARRLERDPTARLVRGLPVENLPDLSYGAAEDDASFAQGVLDRISAIDAGALPHEDWLTLAVMQRSAEMTVEGLGYFWFTNVLTSYSSAVGGLRQLFAAMPLASGQDGERYLRVASQVPAYVRQVEELSRAELERGFVVPAANLPAAIGIVRGAIQPFPAGPLAFPDARAASIPADQVARLREQLDVLVTDRINPALESLVAFLEGEYLAAAPAGVGLSQYPGGDDAYRYLVRAHTTMEITPEQVQQIGHELVAEMQGRMAQIQAEVGFAGSADDFRRHLRSNPEYYPSSPEEVGNRLMDAANAFYARVDELFLSKPRASFGARRLDPALEGSQTYGYYSPPSNTEPTGYYNFNGSQLDERSWLPYQGLAYHELFPGHHFQIALQRENETLHPLRAVAMNTAYTEGWGSYASYLGLEQGMLPDPLSQYGLYMLEIFLATRLVVDPGMNALGMSLEEARQFMRDTTFESETQIATESLRYSADMPGQALGYQMGKRRILELRQRAMDALGDRFDLREFHDVILGSGSLPMTVLEAHVDWYIDGKLASDG